MAAVSHCPLLGARASSVRSKRTASRRGITTTTRAVQTPAKPARVTRENVKSTPLDAFPKSAVGSRRVPKPKSETFDKAYKDYSTGYASVPGLSYERSEWITEVIGTIPPEMEGTLLRNGPAMYVRGEGADRFEKSYLDGDGMVTSIAVKDGKAYFRNKFVRTEHFDKEEALGKYTEPSIFTAADPRKPAFFWRLFNDILAGNLARKQNGAYNVLNWGGNLLAVDYKKPYELCPDTLDTIGHGASPITSVMHTSHYRTLDEPDGSGRRCVAFLNEVDWRSETTGAVFYEFDENGVEVSRRAYDYPASYVHDFVVTDNYYILFDCPIKIDFPAVFTKYIFEKRYVPAFPKSQILGSCLTIQGPDTFLAKRKKLSLRADLRRHQPPAAVPHLPKTRGIPGSENRGGGLLVLRVPPRQRVRRRGREDRVRHVHVGQGTSPHFPNPDTVLPLSW